MRNTHTRILSFLLALHFLLMLLPAEALAAESSAPRDDEILSIALDESEGSARVSLKSNGNSRFVIALYDGDGKLLSTAGAEVPGSTAVQHVSAALPQARPERYELQAFLLNPETSSPLCESFHTDSACAAAVFKGDYSISGVELCPERTGFDLTGSAAGECKALVTLFSEEGDLLFRETAAAQENPETGSMKVSLQTAIPQYFIARVVLCNEKGYPLSAPYTTMAYTWAYEQFEAQTPEDFPEDQVLDFGSSGFGVLTEDVTKVEAPAAASGDSAYTYTAVNAPAEGAVLLMDVEGIQTPVKVKSAAKNADGTVTVQMDDEATLSDFYDVLNIDTEVAVENPQQSRDQPVLAESGESDILKFSGDITAGPLKVGASASVKLKVKVAYDKNFLGEDYFEYKSIVEYKASYSVTVSGAVKSSELPNPPEVMLLKKQVPIGNTGLIANVEISLASEFEFKGSVKGEASVVHEVGFKYDPKNDYEPVKNKEQTSSFEGAADFEISVGPKIEFSIGFLNDLIKGSLSGQVGVKVTGKDTIFEIESKPDKDKIHGCSICIDLSTSIFNEIGAKLTWKLTKRVKGTLIDVELLSGEWELEHGYFSAMNDADSLFKGKPTYYSSPGIEGCANYRYLVTVNTMDMSDQEVTGQPVFVRENGTQIREGSSSYQCYLYPGMYTVAAEFNSVEFTKDFRVLKQPVTVTLRENMSQISGTVTDAMTGEPVSGITVTATGANGLTASRTTNAQGRYFLTVYHGTYTVTFSSDSYQTGSGTWTVEQDRSVVDADIQLLPNSAAYLSGSVVGTLHPSVQIFQDGAAPRRVSVDSSGRFALYLPAGDYVIQATDAFPDQVSVSETITLAPGEERTIQLRFNQTGTLRGTVRNSDGAAISGATVRAGDEGSAVTDSNGRYELTLPVGIYSVQASAGGYAGASPVTVTVTKNEEIQQDFRLTASINGTCGMNLTWKLGNGVLTISGTGEMYDSTAPWRNKGTISLLIIESGVTSIGKNAFNSCKDLTSVTISDSVTSIGESAFRDCTGLTSVTIPDSVTSIGNYAFRGCTGLTSVTIPDSVTSIGNYAFNGCTGLTSVTIPDSVTSIGYSVFYSCTGLTSVTIPDSVTSIGNSAFWGCTGLTSVTIPGSVTSIGNYAFHGCTGLASITIPGSVTSIEGFAFGDCTCLTSAGPIGSSCNIELGWKTVIPSDARYVFKYLTSVTIPDGVTSIGSSAFSSCTGLTSVTIPDSVTSIGNSAFSSCTGLTSVTIPDSVTSIGRNAFSSCTGLTSVTIPDSVTSIGSNAFYGCTGLTSAGPIGSNCNIELGWKTTIPSDAQYVFQYLASVTIPDGVTSIGNYAFSSCTDLSSVTIPDSVTSIGNYAFFSCTGLTSVTIPDSVTSIENSAFRGCTGLTSVTIPDSATSIGDSVFQGCTGLTSVTIHDGVTSIVNYAFQDCTGLTSITIPDSVTSIGHYAFRGCTGLTSVTIPDSVTSIGNYAFSNCTGLTSFTIPDSVTSIGGDAFYGCTGLTSAGPIGSGCDIELGWKTAIPTDAHYGFKYLTSVTIPDGVTSIGNSAFSSCTDLTSVTIPDSVTSIGNYAFQGCTGLTGVTIPDSVTSIGNSAFQDCTGLTSVIIPDSVTSIGNSAFRGCTGLTSVTIPDSVTSIGNYAFYFCTGLTDIYYSGTQEQWNKISKNPAAIPSGATIHFG